MVFKQKDSEEPHFRALELRIKQARDAKKRAGLQKTLNMQRAGVKGEKQSAYHIDFLLKDSPNWAVIHDLRIELHGRVAQRSIISSLIDSSKFTLLRARATARKSVLKTTDGID